MSDILTAAILAAPIILTAWRFLRNDAEARIYITEMAMIVAVLLSYMHVAFSLVTDDSPSWMTALAGCSSAAVGIGLTPIANRRAENRLKAMREHDLE